MNDNSLSGDEVRRSFLLGEMTPQVRKEIGRRAQMRLGREREKGVNNQ